MRFRTALKEVEEYMLTCMSDSAHDKEHVYRVVNYARSISIYESDVNEEILLIACLLHDIGRVDQNDNPSLDHAVCGAKKAYSWLKLKGYSEKFANEVKNCIISHRFRSEESPKSIEAKILYDADKLDVTGAMGVARTLLFTALTNNPLYSVTENYEVSDGLGDTNPSFFQEYRFKLERIYDEFYTKKGQEFAKKRKEAAENFYFSLLSEVKECYQKTSETEILYNKLVRDKIPEIIKGKSQTPVVRILNDKEYINALNMKLKEEVEEYLEDNSIEEICDILEVVYSIVKVKGFSIDDIENYRTKKNHKKGAFTSKLFLEKVIMEDK